MGFLSAILRGILYVYICLYILMYLAFMFIIGMAHTSLSVTSIFIIVMPFVLLVMIQKSILYVAKNRNEEKKQMSGVLIVALIPLVVCTAQLSMNTYTSKFNQDRWLHAEDKRVHMVDDLLQKYKLIAGELFISEKTVRNHISNAMQKLGVKGRSQAVVELLRMGELEL